MDTGNRISVETNANSIDTFYRRTNFISYLLYQENQSSAQRKVRPQHLIISHCNCSTKNVKQKTPGCVWTIGHSTRTIDHFISMLQAFQIELVADIRSFPGSKRYPHFNKEALESSLPGYGISYTHIEELGGRRPAHANSKNSAWKHPAFRGYADYMETGEFEKGIRQLEELAQDIRTAFMCSEAVWWRCHRSLVSDYLKVHGWLVYHIMEVGKAEEHPYTKPAKIVDGKLSYASDSLLF